MASGLDFKALLLQVISGEISGEDKDRFYEMISDEARKEEFRKVLTELVEERADMFAGYEFNPDWESIRQKMLKGGSPLEMEPVISNAEKAVLLKERTIPDTILKKMPVRSLNWAAAAAIFFGVSIGTYFLMRYKTKSENVETNIAKADIAPGGNRATLTLGNGATMMLDSETVGALAQQGNTKISIADSGRLTYIVENNKSSEKPASTEENILTTPRGGQYQLDLTDGTRVWLNSASSIIYPTAFAGKQRFVKVTGEVYFEVVHNPKMPFVVKTDNSVITDLGTSFNIKAYKEEGAITTTLLRGNLKIFVGSITNLLFPGQQEISSFEGESVTIKSSADIDKVMAWRHGKISLTGMSLRQLMTEISRWYDVDIEYSGSVPDKQLHGSIRRDVPLSTVLNALKTYGIETKLEGKKIIIQ